MTNRSFSLLIICLLLASLLAACTKSATGTAIISETAVKTGTAPSSAGTTASTTAAKLTKAVDVTLIHTIAGTSEKKSKAPTPAGTPEATSAANTAKAADGTQFYTSGLPIVDAAKKVTLKVWGATTAADPNKFPVVQLWEKDTGIHVEWVTVSPDGMQEKKNLMWASGNYPDIMGPGTLTESDIETYGPKGIIIPLNAYIDKYLVTFKSNCGSMSVWENTWRRLKYPDGNIYTYPIVQDYFYCNSTVPTINTTWLTKLGLKVPTTPDEFLNVLREFKKKDPNGNGKADEIPFVTQNWKGIYESYAVAGWTGVLTGILNVQDGKVVLPLIGDETREAARWLRQIHSEGLMDPEIYTQNENTAKAKAQAKELVYGFATVWREGNFFGETSALNYYTMAPLMGSKGTRLWYGTHDSSLVSTTWAVTKTCKVPEIVARWVDYMYDPLISLQGNMGLLATSYIKMSDGTYKQTVPEGYKTIGEYFVDNHFQNSPRLLLGNCALISYEDPKEKEIIASGKLVAGMVSSTQKKVHANILLKYLVTEFPPVRASTAETQQLSQYLTDFNKYVEESLTRFVTGQMNLTNDWETYVAQVKKLGYNEILSVYQKQYERYMSGK